MARLILWLCAVLLFLPNTPALAAPRHLGGGEALEFSLTRIISTLLFCLMLAAAIALLMKRNGGRIDLALFRSAVKLRPDRRIEVLETRRISQHADACLLRCDGVDYLILSSQTTQRVLRQSPVPAEDSTS